MKPKNVIDLPYRAITWQQAKVEEVKLAKRRSTAKGTSFRELFKERIDNLNLSYKKAIVTCKYTIEYTCTKDTGKSNKGDLEDREWSYLGLAPYGLKTDDLYKYILLKLFDDFHIYWIVNAIKSARINYVSDINVRDIKMRGNKLKNMILNQLNNREVKVRDGHCVLDYIRAVCNGKVGLKRYSKAALEMELKRCIIGYDTGVSTEKLIRWHDAYHRNVSIYAHDPMYKCFQFSPAKKNEVVRLCYLVQDFHCFPILNEDIIKKIARKGTIDHLANKIENSCESDLIYALQFIDDDAPVWESGCENHVVVPPKDFPVQKAMALSIEKSQSTIPFFKYNNKNTLSAFVHTKLDTLFVDNEDFETRKAVCKTLLN